MPAHRLRVPAIALGIVALVVALLATLLPALAPDAAAQGRGRDPRAEAAEESGLPKVTVVATGGTIAGQSTTPTSFQRYRSGSIPMEEMLAELPELDGVVADVDSVQFGNRGSGGYTIDDLYALSRTVDEALETSDGVVVTSGTDTMEEIGYFLDLTVRSQKPVVMTGAMRPWTVIGSDGQANLFNAIVTAASGKTEWFGTVLMLNDEIHAVRDVTKTSTLRMDTFQTPELGVLGYVDDLKVRIFRAPPRALRVLEGAVAGRVLTGESALEAWQTPFDLREITQDDLPRVEIFYNVQEAGGEAIDAYAAAGVEGVVTAGTGAGGIASAAGQARSRASQQGLVFVSTSRTGSGSVYSGSGNVIPGDNMRPQHARLLLMMSLAFNESVADVRADFIEWSASEADIAALVPDLPRGFEY